MLLVANADWILASRRGELHSSPWLVPPVIGMITAWMIACCGKWTSVQVSAKHTMLSWQRMWTPITVLFGHRSGWSFSQVITACMGTRQQVVVLARFLTQHRKPWTPIILKNTSCQIYLYGQHLGTKKLVTISLLSRKRQKNLNLIKNMGKKFVTLSSSNNICTHLINTMLCMCIITGPDRALGMG